MKSMTGHGRGEAAQEGFKVTVELSAVNRKQSEITIHLPDEIEALEDQIRDEIHQHVSRGKLLVRVGMHAATAAAVKARINFKLAAAYARELRRLAKELKIKDDISLEHLLRAPGVMEPERDASDAKAFWPAVKKALDQALAGFIKMREREGAHLAKDLRNRMASVRQAVAEVSDLAPSVATRYRQNLIERLRAAGLEGVAVEDERVLKEIALFADRSDISEELTRLRSHFVQFDDCLKSRDPVGRTLDFLMQEMNREINTVGSKANDAEIGRRVVTVKAEFEKIREQVQNLE